MIAHFERPYDDAARFEQLEEEARVVARARANVDAVEAHRAVERQIERIAIDELDRVEAKLSAALARQLDKLAVNLDSHVHGVAADELCDEGGEVARAGADVKKRVAGLEFERVERGRVDGRRRVVSDAPADRRVHVRVRAALLWQEARAIDRPEGVEDLGRVAGGALAESVADGVVARLRRRAGGGRLRERMAERVVERVCASVGKGARERVCWRRVAEKRGQQAVQTSGMRRLVATLVVLVPKAVFA
mmetsp:Transcript_28954/g.63369  ORF Transcript_28954/g.63369 Transcript_28954/m.63369 type:complete len:249 (-) Transcript_28954:352-1098(-)